MMFHIENILKVLFVRFMTIINRFFTFCKLINTFGRWVVKGKKTDNSKLALLGQHHTPVVDTSPQNTLFRSLKNLIANNYYNVGFLRGEHNNNSTIHQQFFKIVIRFLSLSLEQNHNQLKSSQ